MKNNILDSLFGNEYFNTMMHTPEVYEKLMEDNFGLSDLNITARVLKHWKDNGLLPDKESAILDVQDGVNQEHADSERGKRNKFNFFELIYLFIVQDLREFGFSLQKIKKIKNILLQKQDLFSAIDNVKMEDIKRLEKEGVNTKSINKFFENKDLIKQNSDEIPDFYLKTTTINLIILTVLVAKFDLRIIITNNGSVTTERINTAGQVPRTLENAQPHIVLPIFLYLFRFLSIEKYKSFYLDFKLLDEQELLILEHVRSGRYKDITITFSEGDTIVLELTEELKIDNTKRLEEILLKGAYQDLQINTQKGEISYSKIKTKKKI